MQFVHVKDLARAATKALTTPTAVGHAFNIANARPVTQTDAVGGLRGGVTQEAFKMVRIPREAIFLQADTP